MMKTVCTICMLFDKGCNLVITMKIKMNSIITDNNKLLAKNVLGLFFNKGIGMS